MIRKLFIVAVVFAGLAGTAWLGRLGYHQWRDEHVVKQARYFLSQSDLKNASLCLQKAVESNPRNIEACRLLAELAEKIHSRNAVLWRRRVAELEPSVARDKILWAKTAIVVGDLASANQALAAIDATGRNTAEYHKTFAALAWGMNQFSVAETNFQEAVRIEPTNLVSRLNLATIQLLSPDTNKTGLGHQTLLQLRTNADTRCPALRELAQDAAHHGAAEQAASYAAELTEQPQSTFADRILQLNILSHTKSANVDRSFSALQLESATNRFKAFDLGKWLFEQGRTNEALVWINTLPPAIQTNLPVSLLTAEGCTTLGKWAELSKRLGAGHWGGEEYLRRIFMAKALRSQNNPAAASAEWRTALKDAGKRLDALNDLAIKTAAWNWEKELDETLWVILKNYPLDKPAFLALYQRLQAAGNTTGLRLLLAQTSAAVPADEGLRNNLACVSLLLNAADPKGHELARSVYDKDPGNPFFLSTYAFSLYLQHKPEEATKLFGPLSAEQLTNPAVAMYYGVVLCGSGNATKAKPYLELAGQGKLLPEEKALLRKAKGI